MVDDRRREAVTITAHVTTARLTYLQSPSWTSRWVLSVFPSHYIPSFPRSHLEGTTQVSDSELRSICRGTSFHHSQATTFLVSDSAARLQVVIGTLTARAPGEIGNSQRQDTDHLVPKMWTVERNPHLHFTTSRALVNKILYVGWCRGSHERPSLDSRASSFSCNLSQRRRQYHA